MHQALLGIIEPSNSGDSNFLKAGRNGHDEWSDDGRLGNDVGAGSALRACPGSACAGDRRIGEISKIDLALSGTRFPTEDIFDCWLYRPANFGTGSSIQIVWLR
jgi:hypothetical protein